MKTRPCRQCGKPIGFVISQKGRSVAVDPEPEGRYVATREGSQQDPDEPRTEYRRCWRAHQENCVDAQRKATP